MLKIIYNVDELRPIVIDAHNIIEQVEREREEPKVKTINRSVVQLNSSKG